MERVPTNGITLSVVQAGPASGPLVILLHGFPETSYGWRHQLGALAESGLRVWAPDQRGYGQSDKPEGVAAYRQQTLVADVLGLADAAGAERFMLVGHDWGGTVAWRVAAAHPERVTKLVVLAGPHPAAMGRVLRHSARQRLRSAYALFFQVPRLPELALRARNFRLLERALVSTSRRGTFTREELAHYREAWAQPGSLTAMLAWYRAARLHGPRSPRRIEVPTLVIWGARDRFLGLAVARASLEYCAAGRLETIERATHWVQHEEPELVNWLLRRELVTAERARPQPEA